MIKYNAGNIQSVQYALERIGVSAEITDDHEEIRKADRVIFPGVGEASSAMANLRQNGLDAVIRELKQPVLGICVGMQLLCKHSEENDANCIGIFPVNVKKFQAGAGLKVPQTGWNSIYELQTPLFNGIADNSYIYNVHSYYVEDSEFTIAKCEYGVEYAAAIRRDNFFGVQFHTEKSATTGEAILRNFIESKL